MDPWKPWERAVTLFLHFLWIGVPVLFFLVVALVGFWTEKP